MYIYDVVFYVYHNRCEQPIKEIEVVRARNVEDAISKAWDARNLSQSIENSELVEVKLNSII